MELSSEPYGNQLWRQNCKAQDKKLKQIVFFKRDRDAGPTRRHTGCFFKRVLRGCRPERLWKDNLVGCWPDWSSPVRARSFTETAIRTSQNVIWYSRNRLY